MKTLFTFILSLLSLTVFGATPSFSSFDTNNFSTSGNKITIINVPYSAVSGAPSYILVVTNLSGNAVVQSTLPFIFPGRVNPVGYGEVRVGGTNFPNFDSAATAAIANAYPVMMGPGWFPATNAITNTIHIYGSGRDTYLVNYCTNDPTGGTTTWGFLTLTNNDYFANFTAVSAIDGPTAGGGQTFFSGGVTGTRSYTNVVIENITTTNSGRDILETLVGTADSDVTVINPDWVHGADGIYFGLPQITIKGGRLRGYHFASDVTGTSYNIHSGGNGRVSIKEVYLYSNNTNSLNIVANVNLGSQVTLGAGCVLSNINSGTIAGTNVLVRHSGSGYIQVDPSVMFSAPPPSIAFGSSSILAGKQISPDFRQARSYATAATAVTTNLPALQFNLASGNSVFYWTNGLASANSIVVCTLNGVDTAMTNVAAVPTAGLITITGNAACTANLKISVAILNPYQ